ncbi:methyltransferase domain-containing protein [Lentzea sp. NPDC054927]
MLRTAEVDETFGATLYPAAQRDELPAEAVAASLGCGNPVALALSNADKSGATNVEFLKGNIEAIPLPGNTIDVVISNCVVNLSVDKPAVFAETFRGRRHARGDRSRGEATRRRIRRCDDSGAERMLMLRRQRLLHLR